MTGFKSNRAKPVTRPDETRRRIVVIDYTNYRGERSWRRIEPLHLHFGSNEYHPEPQWLLDAMDVEKRALRSFAMKDVHAWKIVA